jgi:lipopolysaccharide biosynthesis protein
VTQTGGNHDEGDLVRVAAGTRAAIRADVAAAVLVDVVYDGGETDVLLLPADACSIFEVQTAEVGVILTGRGLRLHAAGPATAAASKVGFAAPLRFGVSVRSVTDRRSNRHGRNALKNLRMMDLGSEALLTLENSRGMFGDEIPALPMPEGKVAFPLRAGVVVHLFYQDLWPEFAQFLRASGLGERLFISITEDGGGIRDRILADFPGAVIRLVPNRGRDVAPFLEMLAEGLFRDCDVVCKLHSKKSAVAQGEYLGRLWRRRNLFDLIGGHAQVMRTLRRFADAPRLGMIGSPVLRLPNARFPDKELETHLPMRISLLRRVGHATPPDDHAFFAGTMFWARVSALEGLERLASQDAGFTDEYLQIGENVEHAIERLFADIVRANGFRIADAMPLAPATAPPGLRRGPRPGEANPAPNAILLGRNADFRARWIDEAPVEVRGKAVALFATYSEAGHLLPCTARYLDFLRNSGHRVVSLIATPDFDAIDATAYRDRSDHVFLRENGGFDFSMWSSALVSAPQLWEAESLLLCNDSMIGPGRPQGLLDRLSASTADVVGLTEGHQGGHHLQSYFIRLNRRALADPELRDFFTTILAWSHKTEVTHRYEIGLTRLVDTAGLSRETLYPLALTGRRADLAQGLNPTLHLWRHLLDQGFPFIKAEVLRDADRLRSQLGSTAGDVPPDLDSDATSSLLAAHGFDIDAVRAHMARMRQERSRNAFLDSAAGSAAPDMKAFRRRVMRLLGIPTKKERITARLKRDHDRSG